MKAILRSLPDWLIGMAAGLMLAVFMLRDAGVDAIADDMRDGGLVLVIASLASRWLASKATKTEFVRDSQNG
ncbi:hypothetical protein [Sphingomonas alba]|uniref:Holin n=1 Tax=Sphingomonas alba TaxID=2908208 RepID=A0ABT0RIC2_9SPHN|nr:hypothetical protein [Sphingomonas alba]MCL6682377.1 hypothetical protein [Sphingomonas alba]